MMLYRPSLSDTTLRTFSIKAGLAASTVTPGSTAPDVSFTVPAIPLAVPCCADAAPGSRSAHTTRTSPTPTTFVRSITSSFCDTRVPRISKSCAVACYGLNKLRSLALFLLRQQFPVQCHSSRRDAVARQSPIDFRRAVDLDGHLLGV